MQFKNSTDVRKVEISLNVPPHFGNGEVNSVGKVLTTSAANRQCNGSFRQKDESLFERGRNSPLAMSQLREQDPIR